MVKIIIFCNTFLFLLFSHTSMAQRFNLSVIGGINAAQVNGDDLAGYDKLGLLAGVRTNYYINDRLDLGVEFLYSQQGSASEVTFSGNNAEFDLTMDYLEIPVLLEIKDWYVDDDDGYYKMRFLVGLSFGRLFRNESTLESFNEEFKTNDFKWVAAAQYHITSHLGAGLRYTRSFIPLDRFEKFGEEFRVIPHHISIYAVYSFL